MAKGYWMVHVDVDDPEQYKRYVAANAKPFAAYGARFLARGGRCEAVEGRSRARNVIIEFPSYEQALACWRCDDYQEAIRLRQPVSTADVLIVEGYDGA